MQLKVRVNDVRLVLSIKLLHLRKVYYLRGRTGIRIDDLLAIVQHGVVLLLLSLHGRFFFGLRDSMGFAAVPILQSVLSIL